MSDLPHEILRCVGELDRDLVRTRLEPATGGVLRAVDRGDTTEALRQLMRIYGAGVQRFCQEALGDSALAQDVCQQVFLQAFRDLPRFAGRSSIRTWLFAIANHRVLDAAKARRRATAHFLAAEASDVAEVPDPRPSAAESLDDTQLHRALVASLDDLDPGIRQIILLRYQQGFRFEEIANIVGGKPGAIQARVTRALPQLRDRIERHIERRSRAAVSSGTSRSRAHRAIPGDQKSTA
jgi:RNA polymerase sigma-70 factor (ECF subfamily)